MVNKIYSIKDILDLLESDSQILKWKSTNDKLFKNLKLKWYHGIWFRGQSDSSWGLTPSVYRVVADQVFEETSLYYNFKNRAALHFKGPKTSFEWLTLMQHYEVPTRLLDWTESILASLYFAVNSHPDKDGRLFILHAKNLAADIGYNYVFDESNYNVILRSEAARFRKIESLKRSNPINNCDEDDLEDIEFSISNSNFKKTIPVFPSRNNLRIQAQSGMFTIAGGKMKIISDGLYPEPFSLENHNIEMEEDKKFLYSIDIDKNSKEKIKEELLLLGVNQSTIFPEPDKIGKHITEYWQLKIK